MSSLILVTVTITAGFIAIFLQSITFHRDIDLKVERVGMTSSVRLKPTGFIRFDPPTKVHSTSPI